MLAVLCWLWKPGRRRDYEPIHVHALARMLEEHMSIPYKLTCVTNVPEGIECDTYPLWEFPHVPPYGSETGWDAYRRLQLFNPETARIFGDRILSIDLDVLILDDLAPLIDESKDFQAVKGTASVVNGSLWTLKSGTNRHVLDDFDPKKAAKKISRRGHTGSDQGWMSVTMPEASTWGIEDGIVTWKQLQSMENLPPNLRMVAYPGNIKPWSSECTLKHQELHKKYMSYLCG